MKTYQMKPDEKLTSDWIIIFKNLTARESFIDFNYIFFTFKWRVPELELKQLLGTSAMFQPHSVQLNLSLALAVGFFF